MQLYLIRHAHAVDSTPDATRTLSARGRTQVANLASFLRQSDAFVPDEIWHSPLVRARETAELLVRGLKSKTSLREVANLVPEHDPATTARALLKANRSVAVVGHEPHLGVLASLLLLGDRSRPVVQMHKAAALALEGEGEFWQVQWHVVPELFA